MCQHSDPPENASLSLRLLQLTSSVYRPTKFLLAHAFLHEVTYSFHKGLPSVATFCSKSAHLYSPQTHHCDNIFHIGLSVPLRPHCHHVRATFLYRNPLPTALAMRAVVTTGALWQPRNYEGFFTPCENRRTYPSLHIRTTPHDGPSLA